MSSATGRVVSLESIKEPVADELKTFQRHFREAMRSPVGLVDLVARYILRQKGKRVRPILVLLSKGIRGNHRAIVPRGDAGGDPAHGHPRPR